jgi:hypothetical protein
LLANRVRWTLEVFSGAKQEKEQEQLSAYITNYTKPHIRYHEHKSAFLAR